MSEEFKELVEFLMAYEPTGRPVMADIISHSWMRADTVTDEEFKAEVDKYIDQVKARQKKEQDKMDVDFQIVLKQRVTRGVADDQIEFWDAFAKSHTFKIEIEENFDPKMK